VEGVTIQPDVVHLNGYAHAASRLPWPVYVVGESRHPMAPRASARTRAHAIRIGRHGAGVLRGLSRAQGAHSHPRRGL